MSDRYTKINGDAIHVPLYKAPHKSSDLKIAGLLFAFNAAAVMSTNTLTHEQGIGHLALSFLSVAVGTIAVRAYDKRFLISSSFGSSANTICIDRKPDDKTPPTSPEMHSKAKRYMIHSLIWPTSLSLLALGSYFSSNLSGDSKSLTEIFCNRLACDNFSKPLIFDPMIGIGLFFYSKFTLSAYRMYKVLKGDHHIVELPPPEPKKEAVPAFQRPAFQAN